MSAESNKQIVSRFFDFVDANDFDSAFAMMADDATWWFPTAEVGGMTVSKQVMRGMVSGFDGVFRDLPRMVRDRMFAEGDLVCLQQHSRGGVTHGGATYENDYLMLVALRDGMITEIREYMNPMMAAGVTAEIEAAAG